LEASGQSTTLVRIRMGRRGGREEEGAMLAVMEKRR
jgi:hypothetical protein